MVDVGAGDGTFAILTARARPHHLIVSIDANLAGLGAGFSRSARQRLANVLFVHGAAPDLPRELGGLADEVRVQFPWGSLLGLVLDADEAFMARLASLLSPGGRLLVCLSITPHDRVARIDEFDERAAWELLARIEATGEFGGGTVESITRDVAKSLHSSWANRLRVGFDRAGWVLDTKRQGSAHRRTRTRYV